MPGKHHSASGQFTLRIDPKVHAELAEIATALGTDLRGLITRMIHNELPAYRHRAKVLSSPHLWKEEADDTDVKVLIFLENVLRKGTFALQGGPFKNPGDAERDMVGRLLAEPFATHPATRALLEEIVKTGKVTSDHLDRFGPEIHKKADDFRKRHSGKEK